MQLGAAAVPERLMCRCLMNRLSLTVFSLVLVLAGFLVWHFGFGINRLEKCREVPTGPRFECFQEIVDETARRGDYAAAFDLVAQAYELDSDFAANCHSSAHEIGKIAYERFSRGEDSTFTSKAYFCGYGFYHGFMEQLLAESGDIAEARALCDLLGEELMAETVDARGACYHGIGHGTVDGTDPRLWGDPRALVNEGIEACELVAGALPDIPRGTGPLYRCTTGAYNSLEILSQNDKYGLQALAIDPFGFCHDEPLLYREGCYTNMIPAVMRLNKDDFEATIADIESIPLITEGVRAGFILDLFHEFIRLHLAEGPDAGLGAVAICHSLRDLLRIACIEGLSGGYLKYGTPARESEGLTYFCTQPILRSDEADACWRYGLTRLRNFYSSEKTQEICLQAPESFRQLCGHR